MSLLHLSEHALYAQATGFVTVSGEGELKVITGTGVYESQVGRRVTDIVPPHIMKNIREAAAQHTSRYFEDNCVVYFHAGNVGDNVIYLEKLRLLDRWDIDLIEFFCKNISTAYENIANYQRIVNESRQLRRTKTGSQ